VRAAASRGQGHDEFITKVHVMTEKNDTWIGGGSAQEADTIAASEWDYRSIKELVAALQAREISRWSTRSRELKRWTGASMPSSSETLSTRARRLRRRTSRWPALGIPMTAKEAFNVAGLPTTWGIPQFKDFVPKEDAVADSRAKGAGAIMLGKTNVRLMLRDWQRYNEIYGTTNNPCVPVCRCPARMVRAATMAGLPVTVAPIDRSQNGLPIGMQIIGPYLEDRTTIAFAEYIEREIGGFVPPPG
jgi:Asp-tRNA(Asn)/Glu-tRNA(Gln) amidotransferase A subunit family amidase